MVLVWYGTSGSEKGERVTPHELLRRKGNLSLDVMKCDRSKCLSAARWCFLTRNLLGAPFCRLDVVAGRCPGGMVLLVVPHQRLALLVVNRH